MIIWANSPFSDIHPSQQQRHVTQWVSDMEARGIRVNLNVNPYGDESALLLDLSQLPVVNGIERGRAVLIETLSALNVVRIDCQPQDVLAWYGPSIVSHGLARGLESGIEPYKSLLTSIEIGELADNLESAVAAMHNDSFRQGGNADEYGSQLQANFEQAAIHDLQRHGLLPADFNHPTVLDRPTQEEERDTEIARLTRNYDPNSSAKQYRSPWEQD
jgi:hypothetical protein